MCRQKDADDPNIEKVARKLEKLGPPERWGPHNECLVRGTTIRLAGALGTDVGFKAPGTSERSEH